MGTLAEDNFPLGTKKKFTVKILVFNKAAGKCTFVFRIHLLFWRRAGRSVARLESSGKEGEEGGDINQRRLMAEM